MIVLTKKMYFVLFDNACFIFVLSQEGSLLNRRLRMRDTLLSAVRLTLTCLFPDKPSAPEGPLEISDVHKEGCKLKWNPPEDDGGVPITEYLVEKFDPEVGE